MKNKGGLYMLLENIDNQKNEKKHQGNRRYSILLLALLFIGMATYGTYAYFTDSTSVDGNIKLTTGTVSFGEIAKGEWVYKQNGNDKIITTGVGEFDFQNVQPGDAFEKTVEVKYTGTLDGLMKVNQFTDNTLVKDLDYKILVDGKVVDPSKAIEVKDMDTFTVKLMVTVPRLDKENTLKDGRQNTTIDLTGLENAVTFTVSQKGVAAQP